MKALKIAGIIGLVSWMAFTSWRIEQTRSLALWTCGVAYADIEGWNLKNKSSPPQHPPVCPFVDLAHGP